VSASHRPWLSPLDSISRSAFNIHFREDGSIANDEI
jgi:hypothetical protein